MNIPSLEKLKQEKARRNYYEYLKYVHAGEYKEIKHGKFIADILNKAIIKRQNMLSGKIPIKKQLFIFSLPPRHSKSMTITETFPSYFLGKFPKDEVILLSYGDDLSKKFSKKNRQKVDEFGKDIFNIELDRETRSVTDWDIGSYKGGCISRGIMAGVTGQGADLLVIDDPIKTREEANSEIYRDKLWAEWEFSISSRTHPSAIIIVIMTRWHQDDLVGRLLNKEYGDVWDWQLINMPLEAEENDILGRKVGEPLWEERFGYDFIEERKKYPQSFNSLYQGRPSSEEGNIIKREWWQYYDELPNIQKKILSVDASFKGDKDSDKVSIQVWGKTGPDVYLIDNDTRRLDFVTTLQAIENMLKKHKGIGAKYVEDKANGSAIINVLNRKLGGFIPVKADVGTGGKVARVEAITPWIESGNVHLPRNAKWLHDFVDECSNFPNTKTDDQVDGMSQALTKLIWFSAKIPQSPKTYTFDFEKPTEEMVPTIEYINY